MTDTYATRREALKARYLGDEPVTATELRTAGVDHLALICSDIERTIDFYTDVLQMRLTKIVANQIGRAHV